MMTYIIIAVLLVAAELIYFRIADKCNIIDKPNERSSHSTIVLRGGGIIFAISMVIWLILQMVNGEWGTAQGYWPFLSGLMLIPYLCPDTVLAHWIYLVMAGLVLEVESGSVILEMKDGKYEPITEADILK